MLAINVSIPNLTVAHLSSLDSLIPKTYP